MRKNIVYQILCDFCNSTYVGETKRTLAARCREHLIKNDGPMYEHLSAAIILCPEKVISRLRFYVVVLLTPYHRTAREQQHILCLQPNLNWLTVSGCVWACMLAVCFLLTSHLSINCLYMCWLRAVGLSQLMKALRNILSLSLYSRRRLSPIYAILSDSMAHLSVDVN